MKSNFTFTVEGETKAVIITQNGNDLTATVNGCVYELTRPTIKAGVLYFSVDGRQVKANVVKQAGEWQVHVAGRPWRVSQPPSAKRNQGTVADLTIPNTGLLTATMPGQVLQILVAVGDVVQRGQPLVVLEAMKMELRLTAPFEGTVEQISCQPGQTVERGQALITVVPAAG